MKISKYIILIITNDNTQNGYFCRYYTQVYGNIRHKKLKTSEIINDDVQKYKTKKDAQEVADYLQEIFNCICIIEEIKKVKRKIHKEVMEEFNFDENAFNDFNKYLIFIINIDNQLYEKIIKSKKVINYEYKIMCYPSMIESYIYYKEFIENKDGNNYV